MASSGHTRAMSNEQEVTVVRQKCCCACCKWHACTHEGTSVAKPQATETREQILCGEHEVQNKQQADLLHKVLVHKHAAEAGWQSMSIRHAIMPLDIGSGMPGWYVIVAYLSQYQVT
jgi:hypothetical protein